MAVFWVVLCCLVEVTDVTEVLAASITRAMSYVSKLLYLVSPKNDPDVNRGVKNSPIATPHYW
jgi:hypothetical protein